MLYEKVAYTNSKLTQKNLYVFLLMGVISPLWSYWYSAYRMMTAQDEDDFIFINNSQQINATFLKLSRVIHIITCSQTFDKI